MGAFDSFRYRDYRLLWTGALLSNVGTWMQTIALGWYVFQLTHSAFWVSFITFVNFVPIVLAPLGGAYTDRFDRKKILMASQAVMMLDALVLSVLAWTGHANLAAVMILTFGQGLMIALNSPAWMAFITSLVPSGTMVNAIALNSAQFNLARVVGPAIAGLIIGLSSSGPSIVFTINAVSFLAVLAALYRIGPHPQQARKKQGVWELLRDGLAYTWQHERIRTMILGLGVMSFFAAPASSLLPVFAADVFHRGAGSYGSLASAAGLGAVTGALLLGRLGNRVSPSVVSAALVAVGVFLVLFASIAVYPAGLILIFLYGVAFLLFVSGNNSDVQLAVEEPFRGRVLSIWMLSFGAFLPLGSLLAGAAAEVWGAQATTIAGGVGCCLGGLAMLQRFRAAAGESSLATSPDPLG
jgi:MFS family permease